MRRVLLWPVCRYFEGFLLVWGTREDLRAGEISLGEEEPASDNFFLGSLWESKQRYRAAWCSFKISLKVRSVGIRLAFYLIKSIWETFKAFSGCFVQCFGGSLLDTFPLRIGYLLYGVTGLHGVGLTADQSRQGATSSMECVVLR